MKTKLWTAGLLILTLMACDDIIEVEDISEESVNLLAPVDEAVLNITDPIFSWQPVADAETYHLQIAQPSFEAALQIVADTTLEGTRYNTSLEINTYEWRVRAENSGYQTDYTTQSFSVEE